MAGLQHQEMGWGQEDLLGQHPHQPPSRPPGIVCILPYLPCTFSCESPEVTTCASPLFSTRELLWALSASHPLWGKAVHKNSQSSGPFLLEPRSPEREDCHWSSQPVCHLELGLLRESCFSGLLMPKRLDSSDSDS